jgi:hypothetical protein
LSLQAIDGRYAIRTSDQMNIGHLSMHAAYSAGTDGHCGKYHTLEADRGGQAVRVRFGAYAENGD